MLKWESGLNSGISAPYRRSLFSFLALTVIAAGVSVFIMRQADLTMAELDKLQKIVTYIPEKEATSNWKTYRNEKYGFEVRYPGTFIVFAGYSGEEPIEADSMSRRLGLARNDGLLRRGEPLAIRIEAITTTSLTPRAWLEQNKERYTTPQEIKYIRDSQFAGRNALELRGGGNLGSVYKLYVTSIDGTLLVIASDNSRDLDQILSTFKFVK